TQLVCASISYLVWGSRKVGLYYSTKSGQTHLDQVKQAIYLHFVKPKSLFCFLLGLHSSCDKRPAIGHWTGTINMRFSISNSVHCANECCNKSIFPDTAESAV